MRYVLPMIAVVFFSLVACSTHDWIEQLDEPTQRRLRYEVDKKTQKKDGTELSYREDGSIFSSRSFVQGVLHGQSIFFTPTGDTSFVENYARGTFHGAFRNFHEDGSLKLKGDYVDGAMQGPWMKYHPNGQLEEKVNFVDNQEQGPFVEYYDNGNLRARGSYIDGDNEHGLLELFDETGTLTRKMECDRGVCKTIWKSTDDEQN